MVMTHVYIATAHYNTVAASLMAARWSYNYIDGLGITFEADEALVKDLKEQVLLCYGVTITAEELRILNENPIEYEEL